MRTVISVFGGVLWRMGVLFIVVSVSLSLLLAGTVMLPEGLSPALLASISGLLNSYEPFEPDEFVFDYTLGADVPRVYYISIPKLGLSAPVVRVEAMAQNIDGRAVSQLYVPNAFAVGWSAASAPVGSRGNTVFVGHNNEYGEVFKNLWDLQVGDEIIVHTATGDRRYTVSQTTMFQELGRPLAERERNGAWLAATQDERLTLVTCWPYYSNTHRAIVVAQPVQ